MFKILTICTGGLARSRAAEHLLNYHAGKWGMNVEATARGTSDVWQGEPLMESLKTALTMRGLRHFSDRLSRQVTRADVQRANLIVCMARDHLDEMQKRYPEAARRMILFNVLAHGTYSDVIDPLPSRKPGDTLPTVGELEQMVKDIETGIVTALPNLYLITLGVQVARL